MIVHLSFREDNVLISLLIYLFIYLFVERGRKGELLETVLSFDLALFLRQGL